MHLSPIFTAAAISSVALHGHHADHLHSSCSNIYSHSLTHKPRHQWEGVQGGGSEGGDDEGLQSRTQLERTFAGQEKTVSEGALP